MIKHYRESQTWKANEPLHGEGEVVARPDDGVLRIFVTLLAHALAVDGHDEVASVETAVLGHGISVHLKKKETKILYKYQIW
jgi:hypothetical protein